MPIDDTYSRLTCRHFPSVKKASPGACDPQPTKLCRVCNACNKKTVKGNNNNNNNEEEKDFTHRELSTLKEKLIGVTSGVLC